MNPRRATLLLALLTAASGGVAHAVTIGCANVPDGTRCDTPCTLGGTCTNHQCIGGIAELDDTLCATGDPCTIGDRCRGGTCIPGMAVTCAPMPCSAGVCVAYVGCVYATPCDMDETEDLAPPPDLATVADATVDLSPPPDLGVGDLAAPDDAVVPPPDLAVPDLAPPPAEMDAAVARDLSPPPVADQSPPPPVEDLATPTERDAAVADLGVADSSRVAVADSGRVAVVDAAVPSPRHDAGVTADADGATVTPDEGAAIWDVRGSGCSVSRRERRDGGAPWLVVLFGLFGLRRRRRRAR